MFNSISVFTAAELVGPGPTRPTLATSLLIQCNLDYLDLVYPDSQLSGLAGDQKIHYHACTEGTTSDFLWVWSQVE